MEHKETRPRGGGRKLSGDGNRAPPETTPIDRKGATPRAGGVDEPRARIFPCVGWAAIRVREAVPYVTWCALGGLDRRGTGRVSLADALDLIEQWRSITRRAAQRIIKTGADAGYWHLAAGRLHLASVARLLVRFGLDRERAPHLVPLRLMRTPGAMSAHLFACIYEIPGHSQRLKKAPLARVVKEEITSIPIKTQRRLDAIASDLVQPVYAKVEAGAPDGIARVGGGYFAGRGGVQWQRLGDYRVPHEHRRASRSAAAHAMRRARLLREQPESRADGAPLVASRGFSPAPGSPPSRRFYSADSENGAREQARREGAQSGVVLGWGKPGTMRFEKVESSTLSASPSRTRIPTQNCPAPDPSVRASAVQR